MNSFKKILKTGVNIDNQIKTSSTTSKKFKNEKSDLTDNIFNYAEQNNLENAVIQISDGKLKFQNVKQHHH